MINIIKEYVTIGNTSNLLYILSFISIVLGIYTIIAKNPIYSILFLISLFVSVSLYLISIGLHFVGLSYLLVYVGAISILFLFIVMLMNIRVSELLTDTSNNIPLAILTTLFFYYYSYDILPYVFPMFKEYIVYKHIFTNNLSLTYDFMTLSLYFLLNTKTFIVKLVSWDNATVYLTHIASIGNVLYTNFLILFVITSLILLLAMIGAIVITINTPKDNTMLKS